MSSNYHIAYFITPHGFGHAARACAVMSALTTRVPDVHFDIYTLVPEWFFRESRLENYTYFPYQTDVGLVQKTSMVEDLEATLVKLEQLYPPRPEMIHQLVDNLRQNVCRLVICDISPLGIAAAHAAGNPAVVVENFTWDWIYENYMGEKPEFNIFIAILRGLLRQADVHIQTTPVCQPNAPHLTTQPVSRPVLASREAIRDRLGISQAQPAVLITMGGIETAFDYLERLASIPDVTFIIPGGSSHLERRGNVLTLPHHSNFYHPDLLNACNLVIGKLGYSTLAEAYTSGVPYGFIPRERFREAGPLTEFTLSEMSSLLIPESRYASGDWLADLPTLLSMPSFQRSVPNGAGQIADYLLNTGLIR